MFISFERWRKDLLIFSRIRNSNDMSKVKINQPAVCIYNLSKLYNLGYASNKASSYFSLREALSENFISIIQKCKSLIQIKSSQKPFSNKELFWALKDISLTINSGDELGLSAEMVQENLLY